jgi:phosphate-selective porin
MQGEGGDVFAFEGRFSPGPNEIKDRFRIRRARLTVTGDYQEEFDFKLEGEFALSDTALTIRDAAGRTLGSNSTRTSFGATDIFINWHRLPELNVKVGQFKAPVGLEQISSDPKLITAERSLVSTALTPERQIGVMLWGKPFANLWPDQKELLNYSLGAFNGTGRNITVNDNNEFMYAGRLEVLAMKSKILNQDASLKFGVNGFASRDDSGTNVSSLLRENNDGSLSAFNLPSAGEREGYGIDASLHIGPFDLVAEYLNERIHPRVLNGIAPLFTSLRPDGYYVQGSYFVIPKALQLAAKWESFNPDQFANDDIHSFTAGVNWYIKGDEIKLIADYIHTWSDFRDNNPVFEHAEFDEVIIRLQLMF